LRPPHDGEFRVGLKQAVQLECRHSEECGRREGQRCLFGGRGTWQKIDAASPVLWVK
jgi:hypothetical protein